MGKQKPTISICDVRHSPTAVQIRLMRNDMPGWFAILNLEPGEIAYLIEQKYLESVSKNKVNDKEATFEGDVNVSYIVSIFSTLGN